MDINSVDEDIEQCQYFNALSFFKAFLKICDCSPIFKGNLIY